MRQKIRRGQRKEDDWVRQFRSWTLFGFWSVLASVDVHGRREILREKEKKK
jgi:hypothetical protein